MKVCVFGAGAIGGLVGAKLAASGADISLIARGERLAAMRDNGLTLISEGRTIVTHPRVTNDAREPGTQDFVIIAVKSHALATAADAIQPLLGPTTTIVPAVNGV